MLAWQPGLSLWKMYYYFTLRKKVRILYVLKAEKKSKLWKRGKLKVYYQIRDGCVLILSIQSPILHFPLKSLRESPYERQDSRTRWSNVPVHHYTKYSLLLFKKKSPWDCSFLCILILYMKIQIFFISVPMTCEQWLLRGKATHLLWCLESGPEPQCENKEWDRSLKRLQIPSRYTFKNE